MEAEEQEEPSVKKAVPLDWEAAFLKNVKTIIVAALTLVIGVFSAGIYWSEVRGKIDTAYDTGKENTSEIKVINGKIVDVTGRVIGLEQFKQDLRTSPPNVVPSSGRLSGLPGGSGNPESTCPEGSYMVGVKTNGNTAPPYCIGCLVSVQVICRPFPRS